MTTDSPLRLAVFDCDGTLVDSAHSIIEAMGMAWQAHGVAVPPSTHDVRSVVGLNLVEAIANLLPDADESDHYRLAEHYKIAFSEIRTRPDHDEPLYAGVRETLDCLDSAGVLLGVATGKSRRGLKVTLERHGLLDRFVVLKTSDDGPGKPDPRILLDAMAELGVAPGETAMIGDTVYDIAMAVNAKVAPIGVEWGYHEADALTAAGAHVVLGAFRDLPSVLESVWRTEQCG